MTTATPILSVSGLTKNFGGVRAVSDVSFQVGRGSITGLIGPNGAGKTTTFNLISGRFPASAGSVRMNDHNLTGLRPDQIAGCGIARTFQGTRIFPHLSSLENVRIAALAGAKVGFWADWIGLRAAREAEAQAEHRADEILQWIGLSAHATETAGALAYAHQSLLGVALALALRPKLLLLDEPFAGMNPGETVQAAEMVRRIRDDGVTVVLVEHDVPAVMRICDRIVVLDQGAKIAEGTPEEVRANERVIEAYLGADTDAES
ncbi:MAG: ABC transporter ATP-binding protein [Betaproteobacteria bacterium]|nr:ABC transporter ATP-binding protein [Betaproteobacteria bacterium]